MCQCLFEGVIIIILRAANEAKRSSVKSKTKARGALEGYANSDRDCVNSINTVQLNGNSSFSLQKCAPPLKR